MPEILAMDMGGTSTRFAMFQTRGDGSLEMGQSVWLPTLRANSFEDLLQTLCQEHPTFDPARFQVFSLAVPGPVEDGAFSQPANIPWSVDLAPLKGKYPGVHIYLLNDFAAQAYACLTPIMDNALVIQKGQADAKAPLGVIGAGTGLGHCALAPDGHGGYLTLPSEAGHGSFAFVGRAESEYHEFMTKETGLPYATGDSVVSGAGLARVHFFLTGDNLSPKQVAQAIGPDSETTAWFSRFYGRACRNYVMSLLARGGLFITGGVAAQNPFLVDNPHFRREFKLSEVYARILAQIPIKLNTNQDSGLWGAARQGLELCPRP